MSKKILVAVVSAMLLVLVMAAGVLSAQNVGFNGSGNGENDFVATPTNEVYLPNAENPGDYKIHSNYTASTDACASCHATHTGVGESLLQFGSASDTCMACHDGTVTNTYNVLDGYIGTTDTRTSSGVFDTHASGSNHNVSGALSVYAAPGGPGTAGIDTKANPNLDGHNAVVSWDIEFGCQSCHSPHGQGGNARLLNPDVNGYAWTQYNAGKTKNVALQVYAADPKIYTSDWNKDGVNDSWIVGYPYSSKVKVDGIVTTVTIDNRSGTTQVKFATAPVGTVTADFFAGVAVKMQVNNYLTANETVTHGSGLNTFCGACHVDYNTSGINSPGSNLNGTYTEAYRHKVGYTYGSVAKLQPMNMKLETGNIVTCGTCHVSHGTDTKYWQDTLTKANNGSLPAGLVVEDLTEISGSSALKRLPNMGVCETCHAKGAGNGSSGTSTVSNPSNFLSNFNPLSSGILDYAGISTTLVGGKKSFGLFLQANGTGFFKNEEYIGSEACKSCHANYYEGWKNRGHSESILSPMEADLAAEFAGTGIVTHIITSTGFINGVDGAASDTPAGTEWSYTINYDTKTLTYDYYAATGTGTPEAKTATQNAIAKTPQGTAVVNLADLSGLWMEHYVISKTNPTAGGPAVPAYGYYRVAQIDEAAPVGSKLHPYLARLKEFPTAPSIASYYATNTDASSETTGCLSCHSPKSLGAIGTPDSTIGCEACHGPAARHAKTPSAFNILNPANPANGLSATQQTNLCLTCHSGGHNAKLIKGTAHDANDALGITCTSCHDVHNTMKDGTHSPLRKPENQLCSSCHQNLGYTGDVHTVPKPSI